MWNNNLIIQKIINFILLPSLLIVAIFMHVEIKSVTSNINKEVINTYKLGISNVYDSVFNHIKSKNKSDMITFFADEYNRSSIEELLRQANDNGVQYIYILLKSNNIYNFLADGSQEDKAGFLEPFNFGHDLNNVTDKIIFEYDMSLFDGFTYVKKFNLNDEEIIFVSDISISKFKIIEKDLRLILVYTTAFISMLIFILFTIAFIGHSYRKMKIKAFYDPLTSIYNRNYLSNVDGLFKSNRYVVSLIDIDFFKKINDVYGHDIVLRDVASEISKYIRKDDILIRYGGEEFLLFLSMKDGRGKIDHIVKNILNKTRNLSIFIDSETEVKVTVSIGVCDNFDFDMNVMIKSADKCLYHSKETGRNRITFSDELKEKISCSLS